MGEPGDGTLSADERQRRQGLVRQAAEYMKVADGKLVQFSRAEATRLGFWRWRVERGEPLEGDKEP